MFSVNVLNELNENMKIEVIRYFRALNNQYLIYSLNEKDEAGYVKLYAAKMGVNTFVKIEEEAEWTQIKELIKVIVKEAKENALVSVEDLDYTKIKNVMIESSRVFKLTDAVTEMLGLNKKEFKEEVTLVFEDKKESLEELFKEEDEPKSFEELLAQSTPKTTESLIKEVQEVKLPAFDEVLKETKIEEPQVKKLSPLEELLGQPVKEVVTVKEEVKEVVEPIKEEPKILVQEENIEQLKNRIKELENKIEEIKKILQ
jgi:hypothetical protein